jgi:sorbitol/mannitol transport system substrate-binding protein
VAGKPRLGRHSSCLAALAVLGLVAAACSGAGGGAGGGGGGGGDKTVTVATVANPQMQDIEKLSGEFKKDHPDINVKFVILPENELRDRVTQDIATQAGQYDVATIGTYEVPIWAENGCLTKLDDKASQGGLLPGVEGADEWGAVSTDGVGRKPRRVLARRGFRR